MTQCNSCIHNEVCNISDKNTECNHYKDKNNIKPIIKAIWERRGVKSVNNPSKQFFCSNCGGMVELAHYCFTCYYRYCSFCGAKMEDNNYDFDHGTKRSI